MQGVGDAPTVLNSIDYFTVVIGELSTTLNGL